MQLDWQHFSPWSALGGGALIGLAAAALALGLGRIFGISGIVGGLFAPLDRAERGWRLAVLAGLLAAPWVWQLAGPLPASRLDAGPLVLVVAGLLVGIGTRYGAGCTSGHGVCGLSRLSPRSLAATISFMAAGFAMVYLTRHLWGA